MINQVFVNFLLDSRVRLIYLFKIQCLGENNVKYFSKNCKKTLLSVRFREEAQNHGLHMYCCGYVQKHLEKVCILLKRMIKLALE